MLLSHWNLMNKISRNWKLKSNETIPAPIHIELSDISDNVINYTIVLLFLMAWCLNNTETSYLKSRILVNTNVCMYLYLCFVFVFRLYPQSQGGTQGNSQEHFHVNSQESFYATEIKSFLHFAFTNLNSSCGL